MDPRLYTSAKTGNIYLLKQLLDQNSSLIPKITPHGNTALHIAVLFGHKKIVAEVYSRQRSLLTQQNLDGDTPLHVAARVGHFSIVNFLVAETLRSFEGDIENGRNGGVELLRLGNNGNNTVFHEAVRNHHLRVVELLIKVDPELACLDNHVGESPLYLAARDGLVEIVNRILMSAQKSSHGGSDGQNALHAAVDEKHFETIEALLRVKPQLVQETDHRGRNPLHYAAYLGDDRTVRRLLELDTAISYTLDIDGQSPLHMAANKGHTKVIKEIIQNCPDSMELLDSSGRNALHVAILNGKINVVRYMLETKELEGLIYQADSDGNTPLHLAAIGRKSWIVRYLIWDGRVDRRAKNKNGQTALDIDESISEQYQTVSRVTIKSSQMSSIWGQISLPHSATAKQEAAATTIQTYKQMGQTLLMVATLIATVTFAAAFTMPGGFNNNVGPNQGLALLQTSKNLKRFVISDTIAMTCSITAVCIIFWGAVVARESYLYYFASATVLTYIALQTTGTAFITGMAAVLPKHPFVPTMAYIVGSVLHVSTCLFLYQLVQIFSINEAFRFLVHRLCKLRSKFINR